MIAAAVVGIALGVSVLLAWRGVRRIAQRRRGYGRLKIPCSKCHTDLSRRAIWKYDAHGYALGVCFACGQPHQFRVLYQAQGTGVYR